jgi:hypothetical protein
MVRGLNLFREQFRDFEDAFVLIGGAACHEWFAQLGTEFRATKDLDIVLLVEMVNPTFVSALRDFIKNGKYKNQGKSEGVPTLYRFAEPKSPDFPFMLELFCRKPQGIELGDGQVIVPISVGADHHSLSAILLDDAYYALIRDHSEVQKGLRLANATALIPLKARAWLDLTVRKARGESIDSRDIKKHRNDVFRLAATLTGGPGPALSTSITADLTQFLEQLPEGSPEWAGIQASLKNTIADGLTFPELRFAIQRYFRA